MSENSGLDLDEKFGTNSKAEIEGVWQELGGGAAVKVARLGNPVAKRAYRKMPKSIRNVIEDGTLDDHGAEDFLTKFLADNILKDWRGLAVDGNALPSYDPVAGKKFLKKYRRFRERIWELSADDDLFNVEAEEDAKNSPGLSTGISGTTPMPSKLSGVGS